MREYEEPINVFRLIAYASTKEALMLWKNNSDNND